MKFSSRATLALALALSPATALANGDWTPPNHGFQIQTQTVGGIPQRSGAPATITGTITLQSSRRGEDSDRRDSREGSDRRGSRDSEDSRENLLTLLQKDGVVIQATFPDATTDVSKALSLKAVGRNQVVFTFTTPSLKREDMNTFGIRILRFSEEILGLERIQAKLEKRIQLLSAAIARNQGKASAEDLRALQRLADLLKSVVTKITSRLQRETFLLAEQRFPLQVDNIVAGPSFASTVSNHFRFSVGYDLGSAIEGEKTSVSGTVHHLGRKDDDGEEDSENLWLTTFKWNGAQVKTIGPQAISVGGSVSFTYHTPKLGPVVINDFSVSLNAVEREDHQRFEVGRLFGSLDFVLPTAADRVSPQWLAGSSVSTTPPYIQNLPLVSATVQDSFGLIDVPTIQAILNFTANSGGQTTADMTNKLLIRSPDQGQTQTVSGDLNPLPEGVYTLKLTAKDLAGNSAIPNPLQASFRIDRTPPVIVLGAQDHVLTNRKAFPIPVTVTDLSPVTTTVIQNGSVIFTTPQPIFTANVTLTEGPNIIEIDSIDAAGNAATPAKLVDITLDTIPPVLSGVKPANGSIIQTLAFGVSGQSNESLLYAKVNGANLTLSADKLSFSGSTSAQVEGPFPLHLEVADLAGNVATLDETVQIVLKVLNGSLLSVVPSPTTNQLQIIGAPSATRPGITVSASSSLLNSGSAVGAADGSFVIKLFPFTQATVTATDPSIGRTDTVTVTFGTSSGTLLSGSVKDTDGNPLAGVTVGIQSTGQRTTTDSSGVFLFNQPVTGDQILVVDGATVPIQPPPAPQRKFARTNVAISIGVSQSNVLQNPIFLAPIPTDGSAITVTVRSGAFVTDPNAPGVSINIPAGVATFPDGSPSGTVALRTISSAVSTIPPMKFALPNRVVSLEPSGMAFSQPIDLTLPNVNQLPPGTEMVILSMNSRKGIWEIDGAAQVDPTGASVVTKSGMGITHFSAVYAAPIGPKVFQIGSKDQPGANTFDGALTTSIMLPSFKSLGQDVTPTLLYRSSWAKPTALITNLFDIPKSRVTLLPPSGLKRPMTVERCILFFCSSVDFDVYNQVSTQVEAAYTPQFITAQFFGQGITSDLMKFTGVPNRSAISYAMDLKDPSSGAYLQSGVYPYQSHYEIHLQEMIVATRTVSSWTSVGPPQVRQDNFSETQQLEEAFPEDLGGVVYLQNETTSSAGRGWKIGAGQRISNPDGNRVMVEEEDGSISAYTLSNSISTLARASDQGLDFSQAVDISQWPDAYVMDTGKGIYHLDLTNASASARFVGTLFNLQGGVLNSTTDYNYVLPVAAPAGDFTPSPKVECYARSQLLSHLASHCDVQHYFYTFNDTPKPQQFASLGNGLLLATDQARHIIFKAQNGQTSRVAGTFGIPSVGSVFEDRYHVATSDPNGLVNFCHIIGNEAYANNPGVTQNSSESNDHVNAFCAGTPGVSCSFWFGLGGVQAAGSLNPRASCANMPANGDPTFAGPGEWPTPGFNGDGVLGSTQFNQPMGIAAGPRNGTVVVADTGNNRVRLLDLNSGTVSTIAGTGQTFDAGDGGVATQAAIYHPRGVVYDSLGNLFISSENGLIREVDLTGRISTLAGSLSGATNVGDNIPASQLKLSRPYGMVIDNLRGFLYVADTGASVVRRIDFRTKLATTVAGTGFTGFNGEDAPSALQMHLSQPQFVGLDSSGNLIIVDSGNQRIRRVVFQNASSGVLAYAPVNPDNTQLKRNTNGTWTRTYRNGSVATFDSQGLQISIIDRVGRQTSYQHDPAGRIQTLTLPTGQRVSYNYSGSHLSSILDPAGRSTTFAYNGNGDLSQVTFPDGTSRQFGYDPQGLLITEVNQRGFATQYQYNQWNRLANVIRADNSTIAVNDSGSATAANNFTGGSVGQLKSIGMGSGQVVDGIQDARSVSTQFAKDYRGYISTVVDGTGSTTQLTRNLQGKVTQILRPDGTKVTYSYDLTTGDLLSQTDTATSVTTSQTFDTFGNVLTQTNARGFSVQSTYAPASGLLLTKTDPLLHSLTYTYNTFGLPATVRNQLGKLTSYSYDSSGNLLVTTDALNRTQSVSRDAAGNVTAAQDFGGRVTRFEYDLFNRLAAVISPKNERTEYSYLATGELSRVKDPSGNATLLEYDLLGRVSKRNDSQGHVTRRAYDANGNLAQEVDANGNTKAFVYDNLNRPTQKILPDNLISLAYDGRGNTTLAKNLQSEISFVYDLNHRITSTTVRGLGAFSDFAQTTLGYSYDGNGNRLTLTDPIGTTNYSYDAADRLAALTNPKRESFSFEIDAAGRLTRLVRPGGASVYSFDDANQLVSIIHRDPAGTAIASVAYGRALSGKITDASGPRGTHSFSYDADDQLVSATNPEANGSYQNETFSYDALANRLADQAGAYSYDAQSQRLVEDYRYFYFYDAGGNLTSKQAKGLTGEVTNFSYSSENQLLGFKVYLPGSNSPVREVDYLYDALGRRIQKKVVDHQGIADPRRTFARRYVYDGQEICLESDGSNQILARYTNSSLRTDDTIAVDVTPAGAAAKLAQTPGSFFYLKDSLGSIVDVVSASGVVVQHYVYSAFGQLLSIQDAQAADISSIPVLATSYAFANRELDTESGLYFNRARYYDPRAGRFLQRDPHPGDLERPITVVNGFTYAGNSPANFVDSSGQIFGVDDLLLIGIVGAIGGIGSAIAGENFLLGVVKGLALGGAFTGIAALVGGIEGLISGAELGVFEAGPGLTGAALGVINPSLTAGIVAGALSLPAAIGLFFPSSGSFFRTYAESFLVTGGVVNVLFSATGWAGLKIGDATFHWNTSTAGIIQGSVESVTPFIPLGFAPFRGSQ